MIVIAVRNNIKLSTPTNESDNKNGCAGLIGKEAGRNII
jgi:hypothetical protein